MDPEVQALCAEKHKNIEDTLDMHNDRLNNHSERIKTLEGNQIRTDTVVTNLCDQLKALTTAIWWFIGVVVVACLGFVAWYIQSLPR